MFQDEILYGKRAKNCLFVIELLPMRNAHPSMAIGGGTSPNSTGVVSSGFSLLFYGVISSRIKWGLHQAELIAKGLGPSRDLNPSPYLSTWNCLAGPGENVKEGNYALPFFL